MMRILTLLCCLKVVLFQCKREKLSSLGADLVYHGTDCEQSELAGRNMATPPGHAHPVEFVSPYNDLEVSCH